MTEDEILAAAKKIEDARILQRHRASLIKDIRCGLVNYRQMSGEHDPFWFMTPAERSRLATFLESQWGIQ